MTVRTWSRRHRSGLGIAAVVVLLLAAVTVLTSRNPGFADPLDPQSADYEGARAVAQVLEDRGIEVDVVRRASQLEDADVGEDATLLVTSADNLGLETAQQFGERAAEAGAVVVADPSATLLQVLDLPLRDQDPPSTRELAAECDDPLLGDLTTDRGLSDAIGTEGSGADTETCFHVGEGPGLVVRVEGEFTTYAVRGTPLLSNGAIEDADNAAAALRLLGQQPRLVWYVADVRDIDVGDEGSASAQLPRALGPSLWLIAVATVALLLWRARRLGPLVVEPLPVVVKAIESTQGRGRLYRKMRDRQHAAQVLRTATVRRLTAHLRLPAASSLEQVATAVSPLTGRDPHHLLDLLRARPVTDDRTLTALAADLAALEKEVHRP